MYLHSVPAPNSIASLSAGRQPQRLYILQLFAEMFLPGLGGESRNGPGSGRVPFFECIRKDARHLAIKMVDLPLVAL